MSFVVIVFIFSLSGIIVALLNNDLVIEKSTNYLLQKKFNLILNDVEDENEFKKKIKEKEEELEKIDEERKKNIEDKIKKIFEEEKKKKEEEEKRKNKLEDKNK